jgi:glycosyltransferase involved in cell wall biosynthesis
MAPQVSVLMSVYNGDRYLNEAIDSILNQTFPDFEFLITDDGSVDTSLKILQTYAARDRRIRLYTQANQGLTRTLNTMLDQAQGELIARFDADDIALPERFEKQVAFLQQHSDVVCVGSSLDWIDEQGRFIGHCPMPESDEILQQLMLGGISLLHHPTAMVRRSVMVQVGGYDTSLKTSADLDLWLRLGEVGKLANIKESLVLYRLHPQSITSAKQEQQAKDALTACQKAWERRNIQGNFIRPPADHISQCEFWLKRGWEAYRAKRYDVARRCGWRALKINPHKRNTWKLLIYSTIRCFIPS